MAMASDFYLRYYVGHKGKFGHEFLEFEFRPDGECRRDRGRASRPESGFLFSLSSLFQFTCLVMRPGLVV